jgi:ABC-type transport system involved in multi-copper enzyme maturation permease subunit
LLDFLRQNLFRQLLPVLPLISIMITADLVSGEFSNRTAMVLYTNINRKTFMRAKIEFLVISLVIYVSLLWISLIIATFVLFHSVISFNYLITGYVLVFTYLLFYVSFSFLLSSLTQNTFVAFLVPFFYVYFGGFFIALDMELLSYNYYGNTVFSFIKDILIHNNYTINDFPLLVFSFIMYFGLPIILFIVTYFEFKKIDIRV